MLDAGDERERPTTGRAEAAFTAEERAGEAVFLARCAGCHPPPLFTDHAFHNIGLDDRYPDTHERLAWGRGRITRSPTDKGAFKTPTLRNVALTAPYMHDGRLATLAAVFAHYRDGVKDTPALDDRLRLADGARGIPISAVEETQLTAFLFTLTDEAFVTDPGHGPP